MKALNDVGALLGRILLAAIFVHAGVGKFSNPTMFEKYMAGAGMPGALVPALLYLAALIELVGGILVGVGLQARTAAVILFVFLIPVTIIFHWIPNQDIQVYKNLAIMGGLMLVVAQGPGRISFERAQ